MMVELESDVEVRSDGVRQIREELEKALCGGREKEDGGINIRLMI